MIEKAGRSCFLPAFFVILQLSCVEFDGSACAKGLDGLVAEGLPEVVQGMGTGAVPAIENEVIGFELPGQGNAVGEGGFTGVEQVEPTDDGGDFVIREFFLHSFKDVGVTGMGTADDDNDAFGCLDCHGSVIDEGDRACCIFVEEVAGGRGIAAGLVRDVGHQVEAVIQLDSMVHWMEMGRDVFPGMERDAGDADWLPVPELVGFMPDVGVGIDRWIGLEAVVEGKAAGVVIMAVGDGDAFEPFKADAHPSGVFLVDVAGAGVHEPAVAVGQFNQYGKPVFTEAGF